MKKIVFVTSRFPNALDGGFEIKNFNLIKQLSKYFIVSAHFIQRTEPHPDAIDKIKQFCAVNIHKPSYREVLGGIIRHIFTGKSLQSALYRSKSAKTAIATDLVSADVALCSVIRTHEYIKDFSGPQFYDLADSLGQVYANNKQNSSGIWKLAYWVECGRLLKEELAIVKRAAGVFFFNETEAQYYSKYDNVFVVPHGVNEAAFLSTEIDQSYSNSLAFIGKLNVAHNVAMLEWFVDNVLPKVPNEVTLNVIGADPNSTVSDLVSKNPRVRLLGFVADPYLILRSSIASICPLQTGGGIQNKIIDSLASGAITICNPKAATPFSPLEESAVLVCKTIDEWVETIDLVRSKPSEFEKTRELGRNFAKQRFSWDAYGKFIRQKIISSFPRPSK